MPALILGNSSQTAPWASVFDRPAHAAKPARAPAGGWA